MDHAFNTNIAAEYDVNIAILLQNFKFWTFNNLANNRHIYDGLCWSYDTLEALADLFPYWSRRQIERIINNAFDAGLLQKGNYNQTKYDRTVWYALTPLAYSFYPELLKEKYLKSLYLSISPNGEMDFTKWRNRFPQTVTPIPDTNPDTKPFIKDKGASNESPNMVYTESDEAMDKKQKSDYFCDHALKDKKEPQGFESNEHSTKSDYFENQSNNKTNCKDVTLFGFKTILNENIFQVPDQIILDWIENRKKKKAPVTRTAWNKILKELTKCQEQGINPIEAFETMVASGWQSLKVEYFQQKEKEKNLSGSQWDVDSVMRA